MKRNLKVWLKAMVLVLMTCASDPMPLANPAWAAQETPLQQATPPAGSAPGYADVNRVITKHLCTVCHGGSEPRAGLSLDDYKSMMKGAKSGPVIIPGKPADSEIVRRLKGTSEPRMPSGGPPWLSDEEMSLIEEWIRAGAKP
jgi:cytochrome c5